MNALGGLEVTRDADVGVVTGLTAARRPTPRLGVNPSPGPGGREPSREPGLDWCLKNHQDSTTALVSTIYSINFSRDDVHVHGLVLRVHLSSVRMRCKRVLKLRANRTSK